MSIQEEARKLGAEFAVETILKYLGEDPNREGLKETPRRLVAALTELCTKRKFEFTVFEAEGMDQMIVQSNIPMYSLCEHHMLPFMGTAAVAYIPDGKIVGLSKLTRAVKYCSAGLQNQERITMAIAQMLEDNLKPKGIGVVIKALHTCMSLRGPQVPDVWTTTSCMKGLLLEDPSARAEFFSLIK